MLDPAIAFSKWEAIKTVGIVRTSFVGLYIEETGISIVVGS